jgi:hypothetical protein
MDNNVALQPKDKFKELWKRPGGGFAKLTGILAILGIGYAFFKFALPFLVAATANLLLFVAELAALAAIVYIVTNKKTRRLISLLWLQLMRKAYGLVVNIDPIAILENGIREMREKLQIIDKNVTNLGSILVRMKRKLKEYEENFENNVRKKTAIENKLRNTTDQSERTKLMAQLQLTSNEIVRGKKQIENQRARIQTSEKYLKVMQKLQIAVGYKVQDAQNEHDFRVEEYEQAVAQSTAMKNINSIMHGILTSSMEQELAMKTVNDTINQSIAEINRLIDGSNDILTNFEINSDINLDKANEIMAEFEKNGFGIFDKPVEDTGNISFSHKAIGSSIQPETIEFSDIATREPIPASTSGETPKSSYFGG